MNNRAGSVSALASPSGPEPVGWGCVWRELANEFAGINLEYVGEIEQGRDAGQHMAVLVVADRGDRAAALVGEIELGEPRRLAALPQTEPELGCGGGHGRLRHPETLIEALLIRYTFRNN